MIYSPDAKSLIYSEIQFVSIAAPKGKTRVYVDLDRIFDEVSAEITTLYFGDVVQPEAKFHFNTSAPSFGVEIANQG
jgi:hypothetical protein